MFKSCLHNVTLEAKDMQKLRKGAAMPQKSIRCLVRPQPSPWDLGGHHENLDTGSSGERYNI